MSPKIKTTQMHIYIYIYYEHHISNTKSNSNTFSLNEKSVTSKISFSFWKLILNPSKLLFSILRNQVRGPTILLKHYSFIEYQKTGYPIQMGYYRWCGAPYTFNFWGFIHSFHLFKHLFFKQAGGIKTIMLLYQWCFTISAWYPCKPFSLIFDVLLVRVLILHFLFSYL